MGLFGNLMNSIFHAAGKAEAPPDAYKPGAGNPMRTTPVTGTGIDPKTGGPAAAPPAATAAPAAPVAQVDVEAILTGMAATHGEKLDWKHSIVDLMKLVGMDSSLSERKELATELGYTGDMGDSAKMNIWLHKEVMRKLAENGGKVPANLLD